ncbi:MAG TPA: flagellar hook assembly protein FlgD [Burkholderiaceae bacterium]|nr:flagellar hook assembly protein FlgD [Burkholderiaceae bacterium]
MTTVNGATSPSAAASGGGSAAPNAAAAAQFESVLAQLRGAGAGAAAAAGASSSSDPSGTSMDEGEDRFLKLLVAQMRNQDPMNPLDNAQVTSQLAQINTVRGLEKLNATVQKIVDAGESTRTTDAAALVGRRVLVDGSSLELPEGGTATAGFSLARGASTVRIEVLDRAGSVVDTRTRADVPAGVQSFEWDGKAGTRTLPAGTYTLRVSAANGNEPVDATPLVSAPVKALVRAADGSASLQLGPLGSRPMADVRAIL